jgi:hypothetical protein
LVSSKPLAALDAPAAKAALRGAGFDFRHARFGVRAYEIVYRTPDLHGAMTTASGVVALPRNDDPDWQLVSYTHGTTTYRQDVASRWKDDYATAPAVMYASAGFAAALPDYLGLGDGPGVHPWMHLATETSAALDMLRATRQFVAERHRSLAHDVLVTGFSQGASSALGLARALQDGADPHFGVGAVAPISGAYDFAGVELPALLGGKLEPKSSVAYTGLMLTSWDRTFDLYTDPATVFSAPYAAKMSHLFDGSTTGEEMMKTVPATVDHLLTGRGRAMLEHPSKSLVTALAQTDAACRWTPTIPVRLYVADHDEQAASANTPSCLEHLGGSRATVVDLGTPEHFGSRHIGSNLAGSAAALAWFLEKPRA